MNISSAIIPTIEFEETFNVDPHIDQMKEAWVYSVPVSFLYFAAVQVGQKYMEDKDPWNLRVPLFFWSALLAVFSWLGTARLTVFLAITIQEEGFFPSLCSIKHKIDNPVWLWLYLFIISKLPELGDTFFIVARKSKLHFLHWYHHITVFIYSFYLCAHPHSSMIWYAGMNFAVHAMMYTYYTLRAARVPIPRCLAMFVTTCQLSQMVVGVVIQVTAAYLVYVEDKSCDCTTRDILFGMTIYLSYMVLFADFFYRSYFGKRDKVKKS